MIAIIDYGVGNLKSIQKAVELAGTRAGITADYKTASKASGIILPGVGAFGPAMEIIKKNKLDRLFNEFVDSGKPILGICLGMQLLFEGSEENGWNKGLGYFKGKVKRFPATRGLKIPQMGWNSVKISSTPSGIFDKIRDGSYFYFVHSYICVPKNSRSVTGTTVHGVKFASAVERGAVFGVQFHPEKSADAGLRIINNFCRLTPRA